MLRFPCTSPEYCAPVFLRPALGDFALARDWMQVLIDESAHAESPAALHTSPDHEPVAGLEDVQRHLLTCAATNIVVSAVPRTSGGEGDVCVCVCVCVCVTERETARQRERERDRERERERERQRERGGFQIYPSIHLRTMSL